MCVTIMPRAEHERGNGYSPLGMQPDTKEHADE